MTKKPRIVTHGGAWGGSAAELDRNLRKSVIEQQWHNYQVTKDIECLAQICECADFFEQQREIGAALASLLRDQSRRSLGYEAALAWDEACRLYEVISRDPEWKDGSTHSKRLRVAEILSVEPGKRHKWAEALRKNLSDRKLRK